VTVSLQAKRFLDDIAQSRIKSGQWPSTKFATEGETESPLMQTFLTVSVQSGCRIREVAYLLDDDIEPDKAWAPRSCGITTGGRIIDG
jgi:hypothetical protein